MPHDEYGIYRKPTASVIAAWLGVAAAIFFGAYSVKVKDRLQKTLTGVQEAREEADQLKLTMLRQQGEIQSLKSELESLRSTAPAVPAAAPETTAKPVTLAPAPQPQIKPVPPIASAAVAAEVAQPAIPVPAGADSKSPAPAAKTEPAVRPAAAVIASATEESVSLPAVAAVTRSAGDGAAKNELAEAARLAGEILTFNPDTRKVYLSLGSANGGLQPGNRFSVWRGDKYVTDIRVVKVFSVTSTCEVDGPTPIGIRAGDIARLAARPGNAL